MEKVKKIFGKIKDFAFRRRKRFYIILTVIFSLVLVLDLLIAALVPSQNAFGQMGVTGTFSQTDLSDLDVSDFADFDTDTDSDSDSDSDSSDSSDSDADSSGMPDMSGMPSGGSMPGASDSGSDSDSDSDSDSSFSADGMPSGEMGELPDSDSSFGSADDSDSGDTSDSESDAASESTDTVSTGSGIFGAISVLQRIKSFWIPIAVIAAILDALSITMLVLIRRREKRAAALEEQRQREEMLADGEVHLARPVKKVKKTSAKTWVAVTAIVLVLVIVLVQVLQGTMATEAAETEATVYTETAALGDISTTLPGTGTLEEEDAVEVSLPSEVEITEWYVSNGDTVAVGDTLAKVDVDSALTAIATVQETLDSLDEALTSAEDTETTGTVTAAASGRVKAIYAEEDVSVIDTMYASESLLLLSLDGLMAVSFDTETDVTVGDSVTVTLSDGTEETGTVESSINGTTVVTLTDDGTTLGDSVTVTNSDGTTLGTGTLYIHSELKVMAFSGTVSSISVSVEDEVSSGDTLLSLTDIDNTLEIQLLVEQRTVLEEQMSTLFTLYTDGYLYAETAGVISGLSSSSSSSSDSDSDSDSDSGSDTDSDSTDTTSDTDTSSDSDSSDISADGTSTSDVGSRLASLIQSVFASGTVTVSAEEDETATATETETENDDSTETVSYTNYLGIVTDVTDDTVTVSLYAISGSVSTTAVTGSFTLSSTTVYTWEDGALTESDGSDLAAGDSLILLCTADADTSDLTPICVIAMAASDTDSDSTDETDTSTDTGSDTGSDTTEDSDTYDASGQSDYTGQTDGTDTDGTDSQDASAYGTDSDQLASGTDASDLTDMTGTDATDATGDADTSALTDATAADATGTDATATDAETAVTETLTETVSTTYSVSETTQLSITPQDYVYITITIDELDILSLSVGLEAEVTLDAFPGQSFTGVVESIDLSGTNSGGNSKYTAVVRVDREEDMLAGMNASVKITLDTAEDVLCIPADALVEDETGVYVYTSYNEKTDTLGDLVEVTTGVSDGTTVEILSGLEEGDTYYYSILDTVNYSTSSSYGGVGGFSFGSMFGGGGGGM